MEALEIPSKLKITIVVIRVDFFQTNSIESIKMMKWRMIPPWSLKDSFDRCTYSELTTTLSSTIKSRYVSQYCECVYVCIVKVSWSASYATWELFIANPSKVTVERGTINKTWSFLFIIQSKLTVGKLMLLAYIFAATTRRKWVSYLNKTIFCTDSKSELLRWQYQGLQQYELLPQQLK